MELIDQARRHEIDLVWRRALYFWGFISLVAIGYFGSLTEEELPRPILSSLGFILSVSWLLTLKGSKYWQETWEKRQELIEPYIVGNIYGSKRIDKIEEEDRKKENKFDKFKRIIWGSYHFSVTKVAIFSALYISLIWAGLLAFDLNEFTFQYWKPFCKIDPMLILVIYMIIVSTFAFIGLFFCQTDPDDQPQDMEILPR